jgi:phosphate:Na+ symporter
MNGFFTAMLTGLGGLSLFLYGMFLLSEGLKEAAGPRFRKWLSTISAHHVRGYFLGTVMGATVQSSASTVMAVGFLNAGLLTLAGAIPIIAGANLGTSLAMQLISLNISWLWSVLAAAGVIVRILPGDIRRRRVGQAVIGFSLLFLGMQLMSQSVLPFRGTLTGWVSNHPGNDWASFVLSIGISLVFTAIIQSSGVTMGILFSLSAAGVFTNIQQAIPLIIGAQIGTCATALISSAGTSADARRGALAHLFFNLFAGGLAIALLPWLISAATMLNASLTRQIANSHTIIMLAAGLLIVPLTPVLAWLLIKCAPFTSRASDQSNLDETLMNQPEAAIKAAHQELVRATAIVRRGFALNRKLVAKPDRHTYHLVKQTEESIDLIYTVLRNYLIRIATHVHDAHTSAKIQWLNLSLIYLERISDHNDNLADLSLELHERLHDDDLTYGLSICEELYRSAEPLLAAVETAWTIEQPMSGADRASLIRQHRARYLPESEHLQGEIVRRIAANKMKAVTGFIMTEYISEMDRIVRHTKKIAGIIEKSDHVK